MRKRNKFIVTLHVAVYFLLLSFLWGCTNPGISNIEGLIRNDSLAINLNDSNQRFLREKQLFTNKAYWKKMFEDTLELQRKAFEELVKTYTTSETYYGGVITAKNEVIFTSNRKLIRTANDRPNVLALIGIVLVTGILGGLAGPRFSMLDDKTEKAMENAKEKIAQSKFHTQMLKNALNKNDAIGGNSVLQDAINKYENASMELETAADDLKKEAERKYAFVLFGIIAAALSFVALNLFNSKILDFKTEIDYFIFAGYCVLGAVFAKKWILQLYEAISKKKE